MGGGVRKSALDEVEEEARFIVRADEKHDGRDRRLERREICWKGGGRGEGRKIRNDELESSGKTGASRTRRATVYISVIHFSTFSATEITRSLG